MTDNDSHDAFTVGRIHAVMVGLVGACLIALVIVETLYGVESGRGALAALVAGWLAVAGVGWFTTHMFNAPPRWAIASGAMSYPLLIVMWALVSLTASCNDVSYWRECPFDGIR